MPLLFRASLELGTEGRTLTGIAVPFDSPALVRDGAGPAYWEAFSPTSADVTIRSHDALPVFSRHDYTRDPLGVVTFNNNGTELEFTAPLSMTRAADEMLVLVNDGAMRAVSIGFKPLKQVRQLKADGPLTYRTEIAIRELSLAPTGFGQVPGALVTSVRSEDDEGTPRLDSFRRRRTFLL